MHHYLKLLISILSVGIIVSLLWITSPRSGSNSSHFLSSDLPNKTNSASPFLVHPYLQYPTLNSIRVMWETSGPTTGVVEYDEPKPVLRDKKTEKPIPPELTMKVRSDNSTTIHEVVLTDLKPSSKYIYRVKVTHADGTTAESDVLTFMTAVPENQAWSFTIVGDTQKNPEMTGKIARQMWERRPHFVLHCGDVVDEGPDKKQWTDELFKPSSELFRRVAVLPTLGNHEKNHEHYYRYFSLPNPKYYYKFSYGNADFFAIDSNTIRQLGKESEQYKWLDEELSKSKATWRIVFHHHPAYSSDDDDFGYSWYGSCGDGERRVRELVPLYEKHHVDFVINGHVHVYERTWPIMKGKIDRKHGVTYITSGGGGGKLENFTPTPHWFKAEQRVTFHYCYVTVQGGEWNFKAFDHEGRLFDSITRQKE